MANRDSASNQLIDYKNNLTTSPGIASTGSGNPIGIKDATLTVGPNGPVLLQDFNFLDEMSHFDRERIPERVVHAKGGGAFGYFEVTHDITRYCAAKVFEKIKKRTPVAARFSTVGGESGSADTARDPRGFALKFYTDDGIWDLVGNNTPIFFIRDPILFPSFIHTQKRNPQTHLKDPDMFWDFLTLRPESTHQTSSGLATTSSGNPIGIKDATLTVGPNGPVLLQDFNFLDEISHFDRERIPERVIHAKGGGAFGYFEVTHDITKYCASKVFEKLKKRTPVAARFSTVGGESGSADTARDPRGFALKFYTDDGIWDLVGNNTPIFFIRDPILFPSFIHTQKRNPQTHLKDPDMFWDFITLRPETTHQVAFLFSDRGTPDGFRHMNGYGSHTFKLINLKGEPIYAKFHFKTDQGIKNLDAAAAAQLASSDPDYSIRDLYNSIRTGNYPSWTMYIQVMSYEDARKIRFNPFDVTKIWPQKDYPLIQVGKLVLDRNPTNYFAEVEQIAFSPSHLIPGIEPSPDKMLQGRLFAYSDTHRYRLGPNYLQIPVNCPYRVSVKNYQRDGKMTVNDNQGGAPNYYPNSFSGPEESPRAKSLQPCCPIKGEVYRFSSGDSEDNFGQVTDFWVYILDDAARKRLVTNIAAHLSKASTVIQERAVKNFTLVHADFGRLLTECLNLAQPRASKI